MNDQQLQVELNKMRQDREQWQQDHDQRAELWEKNHNQRADSWEKDHDQRAEHWGNQRSFWYTASILGYATVVSGFWAGLIVLLFK